MATTVVLFGLAPAKIISCEIQSWFFTVCLCLMPIVAASWIGWCWLRRRAFQFSIRALMVLTLIVALFSSLMAVIRPDGLLDSLAPLLTIPARGWRGLNADVYCYVITASYGKWIWAVFEWVAYYGPYLTVALWAGLLMALQSRRMRRAYRQTGSPLPGLRTRLRWLFRPIGRPALATAALVMIAYLLLAPANLDRIEQDFQRAMAFARNPQSYWAEVEEAVQKVRADKKTMARLKQSVQANESESADPDSGN